MREAFAYWLGFGAGLVVSLLERIFGPRPTEDDWRRQDHVTVQRPGLHYPGDSCPVR